MSSLGPLFRQFRQKPHLGGSEFSGILLSRPRKPTSFDTFLKNLENGSVLPSGTFSDFRGNSGNIPDLKLTRFGNFLEFSQKLMISEVRILDFREIQVALDADSGESVTFGIQKGT